MPTPDPMAAAAFPARKINARATASMVWKGKVGVAQTKIPIPIPMAI